jgi:hypothetical protein
MRRTTMRTGILAAALMATAGPVMAQAQNSNEIRIGFLDTEIRTLPNKDRNVQIVTKSMGEATPASWVGESGYSHGELVVASAIRSAREADPTARIRIFASNIYTPEQHVARFAGGRAGRGLEDATKIRLVLNYDLARKAIDWMRSQDVRVLVVTATGRDSEGMRGLSRHAAEQGMILVASTNNDQTRGPVYPAAYPTTISVAGDDRSLPIWSDPALAGYVSYVSDGRAPLGRGRDQEIGSSFAAGSIGGLVGAYAATTAEPTEKGARAWLDQRSESRTYSGRTIASVTFGASAVRPNSIDRLRTVMADRTSKGPVMTDVRTAALAAGMMDRLTPGR